MKSLYFINYSIQSQNVSHTLYKKSLSHTHTGYVCVWLACKKNTNMFVYKDKNIK